MDFAMAPASSATATATTEAAAAAEEPAVDEPQQDDGPTEDAPELADHAVGGDDGDAGDDDEDEDDSDGWDVDDDAFEAISVDGGGEGGAAAAATADHAVGQTTSASATPTPDAATVAAAAAAASQPPPPPPPPPPADTADSAAVRTPETTRPKLSSTSSNSLTLLTPQQPPRPSLAREEQTNEGGGSQTFTPNDSSAAPYNDHQGSYQSHSWGTIGGGGGSGSIFFADATLDLEMAHDLAETPVPPRPKQLVAAAEGRMTADMMAMPGGIGMPPLSHEFDGRGTGGGGAGGSGLGAGGDNADAGAKDNASPVGGGVDAGIASAAMSEDDGATNDDIGRGKMPASPLSATTAASAAPAAAIGGNPLGPKLNGNGRFESDTPAATPRPVGPAGPALDRPMASARSGPTSLPSLQATYRPRRPNRPRDLRWATAALTFIPTSLTLPYVLSKAVRRRGGSGHDGEFSTDWEVAATSTQGHTATLLSTGLAFVATLVIGRLLYRTVGGGDGDNDRARAADLIVMAAPISLAALPTLALVIGLATPGAAWPYALLPLFFFAKDLLALRAGMTSLEISSDLSRRHGHGHGGGSSEGGRRTFFMALSGTALDIVSRSLRRQSFYRFVTVTMAVQFAVIVLWKGALFQALAISHTVLGKILVLLALLGGKWATGLVSRMLSLVASGGVTSWFAQQSILIDEMERMKESRREEEAEEERRRAASSAVNDSVDDVSSQAKKTGDPAADASARAAARAALHSMPEAYRAADASIYSPVIDFDEGIDDDFEDEDEEGMFVGGGSSSGGIGGGGSARQMGARTSSWTGGGSGGRSTVKSFVVSGATVSFGSVAQCGLLGGPAQFVWSVVRNADSLGVILTRRFSSSASQFGFRGMSVSAWDDADEDGAGHNEIGGSGDWRDFAINFYGRFDLAAREFVRCHSDLAMSHVAAYFKSYQRAANDVAALIDASGVEPIIHDDITTRMCAAVGTTITSVVVIFIGYIVSNHRGTADPYAEPLSDRSVCEIMLLSFIFCYTLIFTVMEPLRASIKAVYVCFAQHPQSLSQAFPLIFHRLSRISQANTSEWTSGNAVV